MSPLEKNIIIAQEKIYTQNYDISKSFLPDDEIAINILKKKSPSISDDQAKQIIKGSADQRSLSSQVYPLPSSSGIYEEVKEIKNSVRQSAMLFVFGYKDALQDIAKFAIKIANSISGAAILLAPISFNVPAAICLVFIVIDGLSFIIKKVTELIIHISPLQNLYLLLPKTNPIEPFLNTLMETLMPIIDLLLSIKSIIDSLGVQIVQFLDQSIQFLKDQLSEKKQELNVLNNSIFPDLNKINDKQNEINDIENKLKEAQSAKDKQLTNSSKNGEFPQTLVDESLKDLIQETLSKTEPQIQALSEIIYDLTLPDGSVILDVDPDTIENLKEKFNVVYKD